MHFCGCSKESNNQQKKKIEVAQQKISDSNSTNTISTVSKKTDIEVIESHSPAVNIERNASTRTVSEEVMPNKKTIKGLTGKKESKNKLLHESNMSNPINSKLVEANQSKIKTIYPIPEISKPAIKSKYPIRDYYRLHRGLPRPPK